MPLGGGKAEDGLTELQRLIVEKIFIGFMTEQELADETGYSRQGIINSMSQISGQGMMTATRMSLAAREAGKLGHYRHS